jgi:hypothetical protein
MTQIQTLVPWQIQVQNTIGDKAAITLDPASKKVFGVFDTLSVSIPKYIPIRFFGMNDANPTKRKAAVRIYDGKDEYYSGFDTPTTFVVTFLPGFHYTVEGGDLKKMDRPLVGGSLGPQEFVTDDDKNHFYAMQRFVQTIMRLENSQYDDINKFYATLKQHATQWDQNLYPRIVSIAGDVVDYCRKATSSLGAMIEAENEITTTPIDQRQDLIDGVKDILGDLMNTAQSNQQKADKIYQDLTTYSKTIGEDQLTSTTLFNSYKSKIGSTSQEQDYLRQRINLLRVEIDSLHKQYEQYCIIAGTTPTYLVVPIVGLIAAAIVAGVYGSKAKDALDSIHNASNELADDQTKLDSDSNEMTKLSYCESSLGQINDRLQGAKDAVDAYRGTWGAIAQDLSNNLQQLQSATPQKPFTFKNFQLKVLSQQWNALENNSDKFRLTAYIAVQQA